MLLFYAIVDFFFIYDVAVTFWQQVSVESLILRWHLRLVDFLFKFKIDNNQIYCRHFTYWFSLLFFR